MKRRAAGVRRLTAAALLAAAAPAVCAEPLVVFSEIHYHPPEGSDLEFVEIHNPHGEPVDLGGWALTGGVRCELPRGFELPSGGYAVIAGNPWALSQRFGLSLPKTLDVIHGTTATNGQLKIAWPAKVLKGDIEPGFTIDLAHKDLTLIIQAGNAAKVPMPIAAAAREAFSAARARGFGAKDFSAMVDVLCELAGIEKPRLN